MTVEALAFLKAITFGEPVAEEERNSLDQYFVKTHFWTRLHGGEIDIVYGPKGSGKTALYLLLNGEKDELLNRNIVSTTAENLRGATVFRELETAPPTSEAEFITLWKMYFAAIAARALLQRLPGSVISQKYRDILKKCGVNIEERATLQSIFQSIRNYIVQFKSVEAFEVSTTTEPMTGAPVPTARLVFRDIDAVNSSVDAVTLDHLLKEVDSEFAKSGLQFWLMLDRLDVAFADNPQLEANALRALFRAYGDFRDLDSIRLKIFLRTDIWSAITSPGFREATHIVREAHIVWDRESLFNLVVKRLLNNKVVTERFVADVDLLLGNVDRQRELFYSIFPDQVEAGPNQSRTWDWMVARIADGNKVCAPRDIIYLLNSLVRQQILRLEQGHSCPADGRLFDRQSFERAQAELSNYKLERALFAEYPRARSDIEAFKGSYRSDLSLLTLQHVWNCDEQEATKRAELLCQIGFLEKSGRGLKHPRRFMIPLLFRPALDMKGSSRSFLIK